MPYFPDTDHIVWKFETAQFRVELRVQEEPGYRYDGDDPDGETQAKLDSGEYVAFSSYVLVHWDGAGDDPIAVDSLHGSVYAADEMQQFWTAHRDPDPANRNCIATNTRHVICHYFPGMVREAIRMARAEIRDRPPVPYIRPAA